jgi:5-hydroxyisourate hydrolase
MTRITSHVLDVTAGRPAAGITVRLERLEGSRAELMASAATDADGRVRDWLPEGTGAGRYRLVFETGAWFRAAGRETIYSEVVIHVDVTEGAAHYHLPLLLAPFGYSTYRGS